VAMLGGDVIKVGVGPLLIELMRRRVITHVAMNGSAAIHDFELAAYGGTSEDVAAGLADGTFGMADETGRDMNAAIVEGVREGRGMGEATMDVAGVDTIRGTETVHLRFHIRGGALWYHLDQTLQSWVGRSDFRSRRFRNQTEEKGKRWEHDFDIFADSGFYREAGTDTRLPTVPDPLDDAAFLYWIRTVPLEPGQRYEYRRYFRPERNPVIVEVLGRERVNVAGRKWDAIVLRPKIPNGGGIFAERAEARMWLSDDAQRIMLALQSKFSFGIVTLKLKEYSVPERP